MAKYLLTLGRISNEQQQQQQKIVNQQQARAIEDNKLMQNDVIRKLDLVVGKVEKLNRGKSNETPNSGLNTPETNPKEKTKLPLLHQSIPATYNFMVPDSFCLSWSSFDRRTRMGAYHIHNICSSPFYKNQVFLSYLYNKQTIIYNSDYMI